MKQCIVCQTAEVKNPLKDWHKGPTCKRCYSRIKSREKYIANPEKIKLRNKKWQASNKELIREINKAWSKNNKDKLKEYSIKAKKYKAVYYKANKEKLQKAHAEYYQQNKKNLVSKNLLKRRSDPLERLKHNLSTYINKTLLKFKTNKSKKTIEIVGLTLVEFKLHIESKFLPGMTWDNYGEWHIDHICPISQALNQDELYKLWNYINLRPSWSTFNISKSNKALPESLEKCLILLERQWYEK